MCGIAGQCVISGGTIDKNLLTRMSKLLAHRGPDGEGFYSDDHVGFVHRRLAIIDLSDDAKQPMTNENQDLWLVFNGEIYNYIELRDDLTKKGHIFRSRSDTEVILHAYEEWGSDCLVKLNGMWAFALWDAKNKVLFCARDRFGIKPFYYAVDGGQFFFASEIKALLEHDRAGKKPNETKLLEFLAWSAADHSDETMFDGVYQILPGHFLIVQNAHEIKQKKYWDLSINSQFFSKRGLDDNTAQNCLALLKDAVNLHLRSDVPIGTCLSGGLDSSTLTVIINQRIAQQPLATIPDRQNTFSACFDDRRFDESRFMDIIVKSTGVSSYCISPDPAQFFRDLQNLLYINDEPFAALTIYSQYCVMRKASERVKVVLDGQGADELLAGYIAYQKCHIGGLLRHFHGIDAIRECIGTIRHHRDFVLYAIKQIFIRKARRNFIKGSIQPVDRYIGSLDEALYADLLSTNLPYLLHWEDRTSMAFSIEARVPYLDYRFVEFIASLSQDQKIRNGITKFILRKAIKGLVPEPVRCRMDKKGFSTPEEVWMKHDFQKEILDLFTSESFKKRPYWNAGAVLQNYQEFLEGKSTYSSELWRFACTELWLRLFFDSRQSSV